MNVSILQLLLSMFLISTVLSGCQPAVDGKGVGVDCQSNKCFPADTFVIVKQRGKIKIADLVFGDQILTTVVDCPNCQPYFTQVIGWLHKDPQIKALYLEIIDQEANSFFASPMHNLANADGSYIFAKDVKGVQLFGNEKVSQILKKEKKGAYAPMTESSNYFILKNNEEKVLAHCFANVKNPTFYEPFVKIALKSYDILMGASENKIHPVAAWLMEKLPFLMEQ